MAEEQEIGTGPNAVTDWLRLATAEWVQDELTKPDSVGFVSLDDLQEHAKELLREALSTDACQGLRFSEREQLRRKVAQRIGQRRFRRDVQRLLLSDPVLPVAVTLVNAKCIDDREHWGDEDLSYELRSTWKPTKRHRGVALVHNPAAGIGAAEDQASSASGSLVTTFKRLFAWTKRDKYTEEALDAAAKVAAAGHIFDEVYGTSRGFREKRERHLTEFRELMVVNG